MTDLDIALSVPFAHLERFVFDVLVAFGTADQPARSVARALASASLRGVDSHGVRLLTHYARVLRGGRVNGDPQLTVTRRATGAASVDADNGFGHHASYRAVDVACGLARENGIGAVSVINSSHFGAAGCYALEAADQGLVGFAFCNSDSFVLPHDGVAPFHGTNPISFAAPVAGDRPYLLDMATSILPWNRIQDYRARGLSVPNDVAVDTDGRVALDPSRVAALLPLGGETYGFKGAGLASMMEILSAVLTGMAHCGALIPMVGDDVSTPRRLGHFFIVIDPAAFVARPVYDLGMAAYLAALRAQPAKPGRTVMAPGDREWACHDQRSRDGIPLSNSLLTEFLVLAEEANIDPEILRS